jgi:adenylosuccinate synthase
MVKGGVIGLQFGDEGKAKIDTGLLLVARELYHPDTWIMTERYQGGSNAGHTTVINNVMYKHHQIPCGTAIENCYNLSGKKVFVAPRKLLKEISTLEAQGIQITPNNYGIAANAHVTLDYHLSEDKKNLVGSNHTTTGSGIKQTAVDKAGRIGIRFIEFLDEKFMSQILRERFGNSVYGKTPEKFSASYNQEREQLAQFVTQEHVARNRYAQQFWLAEGAQSVALGLNDGLWPGVTSSDPGDVPNNPDFIVGVMKAYQSSVGFGNRPFIAREQHPELESNLREAWGEYGTTTKKPRGVGWINIPLIRYTTAVSNVNHLALTCLDKLEYLSKINQPVKIVRALRIDGKTNEDWEVMFHRRDTLHKATPIYEIFDPWDKTVEDDGFTLTKNAQKFVSRLETLLGFNFSLIGTGPADTQVIQRENIIEKYINSEVTKNVSIRRNI